MRILILTNSMIGLYKFRKELIDKFIEKGYEVVISSPNDAPKDFINDFENNGVRYIETKIDRRGINLLKDLKLIIDYVRIIKKENPNYVLTYTIKPNIYGSLVAKLLKKRYVNNITGLGTSLQNNTILSKILKKLYKISFSNSTCVFFQNGENLNFFIKNNIFNKSKKNLKLIPGSGVNLEKFKPMIKEENKDKTIFLFIGRIMDEKGLKEYLETAKNIKEKYKNSVEFQILGSYEEEKYRVLIEDLEKKSIIRYLGVSKDIREQVKNVDCVVNPSWHEGMSNVLLEAGAMKKFLIASDIPGCNEIVINDKTGLTFEAKNQKDLEKQVLKYLDLSQDIKEKIMLNCYEHIKNKFNREKVVEKYMQIIKDVIKQ